MNDYMVRGTAANAQLRVFAATTKETAERARLAHNTSPVMTAALGRLLTAGAMMGSMMKGEEDILTLQIRGEGPGKGLMVTADAKGNVKGYALVPQVILPANEKGKLDVGGALMGREYYRSAGENVPEEGAGIPDGGQRAEEDASGASGKEPEAAERSREAPAGENEPAAPVGGVLSVIKDLGMKEPYVGQTALQTGEIAEDLTYYFATSEQVPSSVGLGVLMEKDNTVKQAGGFIVQLMPFTEDKVIAALERNLAAFSSVTKVLDEGKTPGEMLELLLKGLDLEIVDTMPAQFYCGCDKKRVERAIISIGKKEIKEMIFENKDIEVNCHFCNTSYRFSVKELKELLDKSR